MGRWEERPGTPLFFSPFRHLILINLMCYANGASAIRHAHSSPSRDPGSVARPFHLGDPPDDGDNGIERRRRRDLAQKRCGDCDMLDKRVFTALFEVEVCQNIAVLPAASHRD